ncbi:MAG TPA: Tim44/TimA family putative adaptor protein [Patescibacteria group bacterium]|nr:Tim44/TimA family putative adaptor protein [Patescibacteria group bacterium]
MNDGSQFIDIIFFAMVAVYLGLRLRSALGKRTGNERPPAERGFTGGPPPDNVVPMNQPRPAAAAPVASAPPAGSVAAGVAEIVRADSSFSPEAFKSGAAAAFEMIVRAFAQGDEATLRPLLADEVFENFSHAIRSRKEAGEVCQSELVTLSEVDLVDAGMDGRIARVTVRFVSQQIIVIKDAAGTVVEGDPSRTTQIIDLWGFARDTRSRSPNWLLVATASHDE